MNMTRRSHLKLLGASGLVAASGAPLLADSHAAAEPMEHTVQMLNQDPDNPRARQVFSPRILHVQPGDTVNFVSTDRGHNSQSDEDMMPEGGNAWEGDINGDVSVTFDVEGAYGYYCTPHRSAGMVGLILVGNELANYEAIKDVRQRGQAKKIYDEIFAEADALVEEIRGNA